MKRIVLFAIRLFAVIAIVETSLRLYDIAAGTILPDDILYLINPAKKNKHPILEYTSRRSFQGMVRFIEPDALFSVQTNSDGFRTHEFYPKLPGQYRILILGDSFTYGWNANQQETYPAVLERLLQKNISGNIQVFSLGISGYSTLKYDLLMHMYADRIQPDMVIVAVDQSDFSDDRQYAPRYIFTPTGVPIMPKDANDLSFHDDVPFTALSPSGEIISDTRPDILNSFRIGSSLVEHTYTATRFIQTKMFEKRAERENAEPRKIVSYPSLHQTYGDDVSEGIPEKLRADFIPYSFERAKKEYSLTFSLLGDIKKESDKQGIPMLLLSYPYPWMVATDEAIPYQTDAFGAVYDMRENHVYTQLLDEISRQLRVRHIDSTNVFRRNSRNMYGNYDPHFTARGYAQLGEYLYETIRESVGGAVRGR